MNQQSVIMLLVNTVVVIGYAITFFWQKGLINTMNKKLEVLERFQNIVKLDEVEKYVSLIQKNHEIEKDNLRTERISAAVRASINESASRLPDSTKKQIEELVHFSYSILGQLDPESRELFIGKLPASESILRDLFNNEKLNSRILE
jgi:hypothetical protein